MRDYFYLVTYDPARDVRPTIDVRENVAEIAQRISGAFGGRHDVMPSAESFGGLMAGTSVRFGRGGRRGIAFTQEALPSPEELAAALQCHRDRVADLHGRILAVSHPREIVVNGWILDRRQSAELTRAVRTRLRRSIEERTASAIFVQVALLERCIDGEPDLFEAELIEVGRRVLADQGEEGPSAAT
jgi:hypothetical protein